jgi:GDP-L-fucose synthase
MRILLTGSNGYIARSFYSKLKHKYDITCLNRDSVDLTDSNKVDKFFTQNDFFDCVIHAAIKGGNRLIKDSSDTLDQNLQMYFNLIRNKHKFSRFINFGSGAELYQKHTFYGLSKAAIRESILEKNNFFNIRIFGVFDENEENRRFIKNSILNYINKKDITIHQDKKMDFFYMEDLLSLIDFYINSSEPPKEIDCSYENSYFLSDIANTINKLSDYRCNIIIENNERPADYIGAHQKTIKLLGLFDGIKTTYQKLLQL